MSEIAPHFEIHPIMVSQWKRDLMDNATGVLEGMSLSKTAQKTHPEPPLPSKAGMARIAIRLPQHLDSVRKASSCWKGNVFLSIAVQVYSVSGEKGRGNRASDRKKEQHTAFPVTGKR